MKLFKKIKNIIKRPRKHHLDYLAATMGIPFVLLLFYINITNLQNRDKVKDEAPTKQEKVIIEREKLVAPSGGNQVQNQAATPVTCKKEIGPISISFPKEGQKVTENPVSFIIKHNSDEYCTVVWSYRINGSSWSEFSSNSPSVYNMPKGNIKFELRIQSTISDDEESLTRNFTYEGSGTIPVPTATSSSEFN